MKVTFILKNLTDAFYDGNGDSIVGLNTLTDAEKFQKLSRLSKGDLRHCVSMKIGSGQFRDAVDLNMLLREPVTYSYRLEPRKGYRLATFEVTRHA